MGQKSSAAGSNAVGGDDAENGTQLTDSVSLGHILRSAA
jgi:hypothetical protein